MLGKIAKSLKGSNKEGRERIELSEQELLMKQLQKEAEQDVKTRAEQRDAEIEEENRRDEELEKLEEELDMKSLALQSLIAQNEEKVIELFESENDQDFDPLEIHRLAQLNVSFAMQMLNLPLNSEGEIIDGIDLDGNVEVALNNTMNTIVYAEIALKEGKNNESRKKLEEELTFEFKDDESGLQLIDIKNQKENLLEAAEDLDAALGLYNLILLENESQAKEIEEKQKSQYGSLPSDEDIQKLRAEHRAKYNDEVEKFTKTVKARVEVNYGAQLDYLGEKQKNAIIVKTTEELVSNFVTNAPIKESDEMFQKWQALNGFLGSVTNKQIDDNAKEILEREVVEQTVSLAVEKFATKNKDFANISDSDKYDLLTRATLIAQDKTLVPPTSYKDDNSLQVNTGSIEKFIEMYAKDLIKQIKEKDKYLDNLQKSLDGALKDNYGVSSTKVMRKAALKLSNRGKKISNIQQEDEISKGVLVIQVAKKIEEAAKEFYPNEKIDADKVEFFVGIADELVSGYKNRDITLETLITSGDKLLDDVAKNLVLGINQKNINYFAANKLAKGYINEFVDELSGMSSKTEEMDISDEDSLKDDIDNMSLSLDDSLYSDDFESLYSNDSSLSANSDSRVDPVEAHERMPLVNDTAIFQLMKPVAELISKSSKFKLFPNKILLKDKQNALANILINSGVIIDPEKTEENLKNKALDMSFCVSTLSEKMNVSYDLILSKQFKDFVENVVLDERRAYVARNFINRVSDESVKNRREFLKIATLVTEVISLVPEELSNTEKPYEVVDKLLHDYGFIGKNIFGVNKAKFKDLDKYKDVLMLATANPELFEEVEKYVKADKGKGSDLEKLNKVCSAMVGAIRSEYKENVNVEKLTSNSLSDIKLNEILDDKKSKESSSEIIIGSNVKVILESSEKVAQKAGQQFLETLGHIQVESINVETLGLQSNQDMFKVIDVLHAVNVGSDGEEKHLSTTCIRNILTQEGVKSENGLVVQKNGSQLVADKRVLESLIKSARDHGVEIKYDEKPDIQR